MRKGQCTDDERRLGGVAVSMVTRVPLKSESMVAVVRLGLGPGGGPGRTRV